MRKLTAKLRRVYGFTAARVKVKLRNGSMILSENGTWNGCSKPTRQHLLLPALFLPGIVLPFLLQHAVQGWCPPVPLFRRLGVRTREEIEREKFALKALRGDFEEIDSLRRGEEAEDAVEAAKA